jgi:hypothetical protein
MASKTWSGRLPACKTTRTVAFLITPMQFDPQPVGLFLALLARRPPRASVVFTEPPEHAGGMSSSSRRDPFGNVHSGRDRDNHAPQRILDRHTGEIDDVLRAIAPMIMDCRIGRSIVEVQRLGSGARGRRYPLQVPTRCCRQTSVPMTIRWATLNKMPTAKAAA